MAAAPVVHRKSSLGMGNRDGSKSSLLTVNRLLIPKDAYKSPLSSKGATGQLALRRRHTTDNRMSPAPEDLKTVETPAAIQISEKKKDQDHTDVIACQLALKHRLMHSEVKCIIREFLKGERNEAGGFQQEEFDRILGRIFDVSSINKKVSKSAYVASEAAYEINIDKFLTWYVQNMFTAVNALTADQAMTASNNLGYNVAAKHHVSNFVIDKIKSKFDMYDTDKSGKICFEEFEAMFCLILNVKDKADLNPERIKGFWNQADINQDGDIDFEEFTDWYLRYFQVSEDGDDDCAGPLQQYYDGFNPVVGRRRSFSDARDLRD